MKYSRVLAVALALGATSAYAADGSIKFTAPVDGAKVGSQAEVVYEIVPGPGGDHSHIYVDGEEKGVLKQLKGKTMLKDLAPGKHEICLKVVNKGHTPTGQAQCVKVTTG